MTRGRPAAVGAFVLGALVIAVAAILFFGRMHVFARTTRAVVFFTGSVAGLDIGSPVTFRGVNIGSVREIAILVSPDGKAQVPITIELIPGRVHAIGATGNGPDLRRLVAKGLRAQINPVSFITGQSRVDLFFRPDTPAILVQADTGGLVQIPALPSDLEQFRTKFSEIPIQDVAASMQRVLAGVEHLTGKLDASIVPLLEGARHDTDAIARTLDMAQEATTRLLQDASRTLRQVDALTGDTRRQIGDRGAEISRLLATADRVGRQTEALLDTLGGLTAPRARFRGDMEAAARDLAAGARALRGFAQTIERDPSALLRGGRGR